MDVRGLVGLRGVWVSKYVIQVVLCVSNWRV